MWRSEMQILGSRVAMLRGRQGPIAAAAGEERASNERGKEERREV